MVNRRLLLRSRMWNPVWSSNPLPFRMAAESSEVVLPAFMMSCGQCVAAWDSVEPALPNGYPGATPDLLEFEPDAERRRPIWLAPLECEHCAILHLDDVFCGVVLDSILGPGFMERRTSNGFELQSGHHSMCSSVSDRHTDHTDAVDSATTTRSLSGDRG